MKLLPLSLAIALAATAGLAAADDGQRLVRNVSSSPGTTESPEPEGEHAFIKLMNFYVPAQTASGELTTIEYNNIDDVLVKTEEKAKPLINVYVYGPVIGFEEPEASGFAGHGRRDAFGAVRPGRQPTFPTLLMRVPLMFPYRCRIPVVLMIQPANPRSYVKRSPLIPVTPSTFFMRSQATGLWSPGQADTVQAEARYLVIPSRAMMSQPISKSTT